MKYQKLKIIPEVIDDTDIVVHECDIVIPSEFNHDAFIIRDHGHLKGKGYFLGYYPGSYEFIIVEDDSEALVLVTLRKVKENKL